MNPSPPQGKKNNGHTARLEILRLPARLRPVVREDSAMSVGSSFRLRPAESSLLVIDVQEKLLPAIAATPRLLLNIEFLLDAAGLLEVPALATEQYPAGLGRTADRKSVV